MYYADFTVTLTQKYTYTYNRVASSTSPQAMRADVHSLSPQLANPDLRCHPYAQPLNSSFTDLDLLLLVLQIASAMDHLTSRNVSCRVHTYDVYDAWVVIASVWHARLSYMYI